MKYSEHITEYVAENLDKNISFSDYLLEALKSKSHKTRELRIKKLMVLNNINFPICITKYDAKLISSELVSVKPLASPKYPAGYFYIDYKYTTPIKMIRKKKLIYLNRKLKLEYIDYIIKNS